MKTRKEEILKLRLKGMSWTDIAPLFGVTRQRVHQIATGYRTNIRKRPEDIKVWNSIKRESLGVPSGKVYSGSGGRDFVRELVRMRDNHTCQVCGKKWKEGFRRLDVHHLDENMDGKSRSRGITKYDRENLDRLITLCHKCHFNLDITRRKISKANRG